MTAGDGLRQLYSFGGGGGGTLAKSSVSRESFKHVYYFLLESIPHPSSLPFQ